MMFIKAESTSAQAIVDSGELAFILLELDFQTWVFIFVLKDDSYLWVEGISWPRFRKHPKSNSYENDASIIFN